MPYSRFNNERLKIYINGDITQMLANEVKICRCLMLS